LLKRAHSRLSENTPVALDKIDVLLAQVGYFSLERKSAKIIGPFYVLINKSFIAMQKVTSSKLV